MIHMFGTPHHHAEQCEIEIMFLTLQTAWCSQEIGQWQLRAWQAQLPHSALGVPWVPTTFPKAILHPFNS